MPAWHAETVLLQLRLRRYDAAAGADEALAMFAARAPYQAVASAEVRHRVAWVDGMLVAGQPLGREDRRQLADLLRAHGADTLEIDRHGRLLRPVR